MQLEYVTTHYACNRLIAHCGFVNNQYSHDKDNYHGAAKMRATYGLTLHGLDIQNQYCLSCLACSYTCLSDPLFPLLTSITSVFSHTCTLLVGTMLTASRVQSHRKRGSCSGSLHCWPSDSQGWGESYIHEQIWGSNHRTSTQRRAEWKLIKNARVRWMTDRFCWSSALTEEAGRSRVPGAGEPLVASAIVSLPSSCLISGSISMRLLSCLCKW